MLRPHARELNRADIAAELEATRKPPAGTGSVTSN